MKLMKIKKYQFYTAAFYLVSSISLGGSLYFVKEKRESEKAIKQLEWELTNTKKQLEDLEEIENINSIEDLNKYFMGKLLFNIDYAAELSDYNSPQLYIIRPENALGEIQISESLYEKINYILSKQKIHSLYFLNLGDEIDLSKLDILAPTTRDICDRNISQEIIEVVIEDCQDNFPYKILENLNPLYIDIKQDALNDQLFAWLKADNLKDSHIIIESNSTECLEFLANTRKEIGSISIITDSDERSLELLPKLCSRKIQICSRSLYQEHLNFDISLNESTEEIEFIFYNYDMPCNKPNQLEKIKITSPNPSLYVKFSSISGRNFPHINSITYVTEETEFDFPKNTIIHFSGIKYMNRNKELFGRIEYAKDRTIDSMCESLLEESVQKRIERNEGKK